MRRDLALRVHIFATISQAGRRVRTVCPELGKTAIVIIVKTTHTHFLRLLFLFQPFIDPGGVFASQVYRNSMRLVIPNLKVRKKFMKLCRFFFFAFAAISSLVILPFAGAVELTPQQEPPQQSKRELAEVYPPQTIKFILEQKLPGIEISGVTQSPLGGFYQAYYSGQLLYVSTDGRFILNGTLLELGDTIIDHTATAMRLKDAEQAPARKSVIAAIDEQEMVIFKAADEKFKLTVFTDVDCAYCRKLHRDMASLNDAGITVRYLAFPRAGIGSSAYDKLVSIWCATDRQKAMNEAKLNRKFTAMTCANPVAKHYQLTRDFDLSGTPALILEDGELISGYVPHDKLLAHMLEKRELAEKQSVRGAKTAVSQGR